MTIQTDVQPTAMSEDAAIAALVDQMKVAPKGLTAKSGDQDEDDDPDADEGDEGEDTAEAGEDDEDVDPDADADDEDPDPDAEDGEEGEAEDEAPPPPAADPLADDAVVKVTVNGEETEHTIGSLKRLAGQEATLTRKSQEADAVGGRAAMMIQGALDTIVEDLEPYKDVDWLVAQQEMEPEEFKWHRENFARADQRYNSLIKQAGEFEKVVTARRQAQVADQAAEATAELAADVPGWSEKLYGEIMEYGVSQGLEQADVASITSAKVIKLLHKAMVADRATAAVVKKVNLTPARVKKPSGSDEVNGAAPSKAQRQLEQKMASGRGTEDDAVALLMGRWKRK